MASGYVTTYAASAKHNCQQREARKITILLSCTRIAGRAVNFFLLHMITTLWLDAYHFLLVSFDDDDMSYEERLYDNGIVVCRFSMPYPRFGFFARSADFTVDLHKSRMVSEEHQSG